LGSDTSFTYSFSTVPQEIMTGTDVVTPPRVEDYAGQRVLIPGLGETPVSVYLTLFTSMFMHGGIAHIAGNMLFLWIFGDNIEDRLGHVRYSIFYLLCGLIASLAHVFTTAAFAGERGDLLVPSLGASGAISGVLGGYLLLHPARRVTVILFRFLTDVPAWVAIGIWFAFQLISGLGVLGAGSQRGGVAYAAHIGGFLAGLVLIKFFDRGHRVPA
jgi:membrane associated rhomboid family serine protease